MPSLGHADVEDGALPFAAAEHQLRVAVAIFD
jgi:hypothetical protein